MKQNVPSQRRTPHYYLVAILTLLIVVLVGWIWYDARTQPSFENPYPLIDPARSFVAQEHFITNIQPLREELRRITAAHEPNRIGVYFEYLNTGANISINQEERFWPASLSKMPTALAVMKKIERGEWKLSNELVLFYEDRNDDFGTLYRREAGTRLTIEELLKELLINSDDTAHRILIRNLEAENFEEMLNGLGMEELYDKDYNITAKEYSRIFRSLYTSSFLKREYSEMVLRWLAETPFDYYLGSGVPDDILFSHKIGEHDPEATYLDAGLVYVPNRPYLLTVMVKVADGSDETTAKEIMREISEAVYHYVSTY